MRVNWIISTFVGLTDSSIRLRKTLWRWVYNIIAKRDTAGNFLFMNYGYIDENQTRLPLNEEDETYRHYIQLYNHVVEDIDLQNRTILEVGCGRGGGGTFLVRYKNPCFYVGLDLSEKAIDWCKNRFQFPQADWKQGSADDLPFPDNSFDIVVNVESSHCYPSMEKFLSEVKRVLRPNGYFAYCDMRRNPGLAALEKAIQTSGLKTLKQNEITSQVLCGLDQASSKRDAEVASVFPPLFQRTFRTFAGVKDTTVYNMLKKGQMKYFSYLLQK